MRAPRLISIYFNSDPKKYIIECDVNDNHTFEDPLILLDSPLTDPYGINEQGLYALGGEINVSTLLESYKWGIFPWFAYKEADEPHWYCPRQRFVIFPDEIHVSHSLRPLLNKKKYHISVNQKFEDVILNCSNVDSRALHPQAWLSDQIMSVFLRLHKLGYAKSVEVWEEDTLVGGFYGFFQNGVFQGESMFSLSPSASQIGLVLFCRNPVIEGRRVKLIDTQFETPTFKKLGGRYISYKDYRNIMDSETPNES